mmetsp:Transcript_70351/g.142469  ORF Transcript_70351/g.142469 Transcript_70351/m.142469 type:complete len:258 (+) Transcript_70351:520-1293(+)
MTVQVVHEVLPVVTRAGDVDGLDTTCSGVLHNSLAHGAGGVVLDDDVALLQVDEICQQPLRGAGGHDGSRGDLIAHTGGIHTRHCRAVHHSVGAPGAEASCGRNHEVVLGEIGHAGPSGQYLAQALVACHSGGAGSAETLDLMEVIGRDRRGNHLHQHLVGLQVFRQSLCGNTEDVLWGTEALEAHQLGVDRHGTAGTSSHERAHSSSHKGSHRVDVVGGEARQGRTRNQPRTLTCDTQARVTLRRFHQTARRDTRS